MREAEKEVYLIKNCWQLVKKYDWIVDSYMIDFFSQKIWEDRVPATWKVSLQTTQPSDLLRNVIKLVLKLKRRHIKQVFL
jgi:hypothetical protein